MNILGLISQLIGIKTLRLTECSKVGLLKDERHIGIPAILRGGCVTIAKEVAAGCG